MDVYPSEIISAIQSTLVAAGEFALAQPIPVPYQLKPDRSPFTQVELAMEEQIFSFLRTAFPKDQVVSEEHGTIGEYSRCQWFLDPIDGTKVYLTGLPTWGISLGMVEEGVPTLGFFYLPKSREVFWGGRGYGAFFNKTPLDPTRLPDPKDPLVFFGVPANFHRHYTVQFPRVRALGSTAIQMCYVATGASIGTLTRRVNLWDLAGALPILEQTGVQVEFFSGKPFNPADYLDGSRLPEELLVARAGQMELLRGLVKRIDQ